VNKEDFKKIEERLDAYRAGELSDQEIDLLWEKIIENPEYMDYLINSVNLEAIAVQQKKSSGLHRKKSKKTNVFALYGFQGTWSRIAALFIITIGLLSTIYLFGSEYMFEREPMSEIALDNFRSSTLPTAVFDYQVQRAVNMASLEKYDEAIEMLKEIELVHLTDEQRISLMVNKGSILYNRGEHHAAKDLFHEILENYDNLHLLTEERVQWFLANVYLQLGQKELARDHIQKTYDLNGAYKRLAKRYLDLD